MAAFLMSVFVLMVISIGVGFALETVAKLIPQMGVRIGVVAIVRGCFYSGTIVADSYVPAIVPSVLVVPQWISLAADGRFDVILAVPALIVAAVSFLTSVAGFGIYRKSEAGRGQRNRQSDRASYEAALRRLGQVGDGGPQHRDQHQSQGASKDGQ